MKLNGQNVKKYAAGVIRRFFVFEIEQGEKDKLKEIRIIRLHPLQNH